MKPELKETYDQALTNALLPGSGCSASYIEHLKNIIAGEAPVFIPHQYERLIVQDRPTALEKMIENDKLLAACSRHEFNKTAELNFSSMSFNHWKCEHCNGTASDNEKKWYEQGLAHAAQPQHSTEEQLDGHVVDAIATLDVVITNLHLPTSETTKEVAIQALDILTKELMICKN